MGASPITASRFPATIRTCFFQTQRTAPQTLPSRSRKRHCANLIGGVFGIGLSLLVVSTLVQACFYGGFSDSVTWGVVSLCQLSYVRDVWLATQDDDPNDKGDGEATPAMLRDVIVKLTECAPQLYLQSYILFAVGAHGHFVNVFSTLVSASSLSYGIAKRYSFLDLKEKILVFFFLATDQLLRASAYAFILSDAVRPIGITLAVLFLVGLTALVCCAGGSETGCSYLLFGHLVPVSFFQVADPEKSQSEKRAWFLCLIGRYIEMIIYGLLGLTVATTSCGYAPVNEVVAFFALLAVNVVLLLLFVLLDLQEWRSFIVYHAQASGNGDRVG